MNQSGRCQCGNVNYYFDKEKVISAHHCHCKDCQRTTGCGKSTILYIASKNIKVDGELKFYDSKGSLGMTIRRGFCENCGSGVLSYAKELPLLKFVKAGSLEDSSWVKVDSVFFTKSANQWDMPADDIKCYEANPNMLNNLKSVIKAL